MNTSSGSAGRSHLSVQAVLDLLDWKRRIFEAYREVRASDDPGAAWILWRRVRDEMFAEHPQSPIREEDQSTFRRLAYFRYDPRCRVLAELTPAEPDTIDVATSGGSSFRFTRFASARFVMHERDLRLDLFWLDAYGPGLFLPFRDGTSGGSTYGGGRYLLDTVKGADLGAEGGRLVLDFNFSYNPSCAYDPDWVCPLSPPSNRLPVAVEAGERRFATTSSS